MASMSISLTALCSSVEITENVAYLKIVDFTNETTEFQSCPDSKEFAENTINKA